VSFVFSTSNVSIDAVDRSIADRKRTVNRMIHPIPTRTTDLMSNDALRSLDAALARLAPLIDYRPF
jgi:hypothetical protein